ncbi:MAG: CLI_3235 family bacteriocin precursor [Clostridia bacterium]|nr:CLI_3235 family bacteriocin precursor [Clostridia bacterium]
MKKLGKKMNVERETVEAYACLILRGCCACSCTSACAGSPSVNSGMSSSMGSSSANSVGNYVAVAYV